MQSIFPSLKIRRVVLGLCAGILAGCTSTPTIDTAATPTHDGLYPVNGGRMDEAWARPDVSAKSYSKIILQDVGVEYRPGGDTRRRTSGVSVSGHYAMTPEQQQFFEERMRAAFLDELGRGENYEIVTEPGPDALLVRGALLDVVSFVPPDPIGRTDIYLNRVGEASLVLELRDSMSGAVLLRAVDRRAAEDMSGDFTQSNRVTNSAEFQRLARTWARILREGLDRFMAPDDEAGQ